MGLEPFSHRLPGVYRVHQAERIDFSRDNDKEESQGLLQRVAPGLDCLVRSL